MSDEDKDRQSDNDNKKDQDEKPHSKRPLIIAAAVIIVLIIAFIIYYLLTMNDISTDDAYTDGRAIAIGANTSGYVTQLNIDDNSFVHAGDLLAVIDPRDDQASLAQAQANLALANAQLASAELAYTEEQVQAPAQLQQAEAQLAQAQAQLDQTRRNYIREATVDQRAQPASDLDQATEQLRSAQASLKNAQAQVAIAALAPEQIASAAQTVRQRQAQLAQAQASLAQAQAKLSYNTIRAPQDGVITMRNIELGTYVQSGTQLFYIVTPQVWIIANYKETQLTRIRTGDHVDISVDAYPALKLHGVVQSIQLGSGARFSEFPAENATGNFVKIVRRVPVKILITSGLPAGQLLPLGISVEPTVYVK